MRFLPFLGFFELSRACWPIDLNGDTHIGEHGCYDAPVVIHDPHSPAPKDLLEFCFVKCKEKHDELGHWTHAYVAFMPEKDCLVDCICIKEESQRIWALTLSIFGGICVCAKFLMYFGYKTQKALKPPPRESYDAYTNPSFEAALLREIKMEQERKIAERNEEISQISKKLLARRVSVSQPPVFPISISRKMEALDEVSEEDFEGLSESEEIAEKTKF
ncbi:Oidioi.mRNA.OKI2018_I69.chr2.g5124.t1.cds [Oikopleura dioica]|uniref:Oidioi.mRNA.OKI2018_I69.chr2.g5124.t1.cds n=1 Tax=Oikopleura dioica TaxID=34765 RepID=A0ABN7SZX0_OIKDI|nr:Oidioi.mRNA.OKI2018_I69.chr2.g5124.t1.cds [Oikopleura dioica]